MKSGDLKYRIEILEPVKTTTSFGPAIDSFKHKYTCRARVNYLTGDRTIDNEEIFYSVDREFIVRSYVPIKYDDIIRWNDDDWQVLSIDPVREFNDIIIRTTRINK